MGLALLALMLVSCAESNNGIDPSAVKDAPRAFVSRALPAAPGYAAPIAVDEPQPSEALLAVAARERVGRVQANARITAFRQWYENVRNAYAQPPR
jgi:hypothetical protein